MRTYELWERQERTGSPEDHWCGAERERKGNEELTETLQDRTEATVRGAPPVEAVDALKAASASPEESKRSPGRPRGCPQPLISSSVL
jgi:hypothetical protein